jgi:hypothetical protein
MPISAGRPRQADSRRRFVSGLALLISLQAATPASGWARLGHRLTARLAERHLKPTAKAAIAELLEPGETLADASTWADEHKREVSGSASWHFVNLSIDEDSYDPRLVDGRRPSIVPKFREFLAVLEDPDRRVEERRLALRFVVHLVGDVHQPLHVGDNGGNRTQVRFFNRGSNLHHVWDSLIIEHTERDEDRWLARLIEMDTAANRTDAQRGTIEFWASESLRTAREAYRDPVTGERIKPGARLGDGYQAANLPVVKRRLYQAGVRLAMVLNGLWAED